MNTNRSTPRKLVILAGTLMALGASAQAAQCGLFTSLGTDLEVENVVNGGGVADHFLGGCLASGQVASDTASTPLGQVHSVTAVDYGAIQASGSVFSSAAPDQGVIAVFGSAVGDGYVGRTFDQLTMLVDATLRLTTTFSFSGGYTGIPPNGVSGSGQTVINLPTGQLLDDLPAGPGGGVYSVSHDVALHQGDVIGLRNSLYAYAQGSANGFFPLVGSATLDARYSFTVAVLGASAPNLTAAVTTSPVYTALSGHDYTPAAAVPETGTWTLMAVGLAALALRRRGAQRPR
jgi:hypothetical protein